MSYESFDVLIEADGKVKILTKGFRGPICSKEQDKLVALLQSAGLNVKIESTENTGEFYVKEGVRVTAKEQ